MLCQNHAESDYDFVGDPGHYVCCQWVCAGGCKCELCGTRICPDDNLCPDCERAQKREELIAQCWKDGEPEYLPLEVYPHLSD